MRNKKTNFIWNNENIDKLKELVESGLTAIQAGKEMGLTRNAILGKTWRLGISFGGKSNANIPHKIIITKRKPRAKSKPMDDPIVIVKPSIVDQDIAVAELYNGGLTNLLNRASDQCCWPVIETKIGNQEWLFCGNKITVLSCYCEEHRAKMWQLKPRKPLSEKNIYNRPR